MYIYIYICIYIYIYIYILYIYLYKWSLLEHSLVHWYQQCVTVDHVPKCMSCHKAIVVITRRAHCFHDCIYIYIIYTYYILRKTYLKAL